MFFPLSLTEVAVCHAQILADAVRAYRDAVIPPAVARALHRQEPTMPTPSAINARADLDGGLAAIGDLLDMEAAAHLQDMLDQARTNPDFVQALAAKGAVLELSLRPMTDDEAKAWKERQGAPTDAEVEVLKAIVDAPQG